MVAANAVATAAPTYRAMFETPEADPTWLAGTHAVEADEAGPLDRPIPTATATSGSRKTTYFHEDSTKPIAANPTPVSRKPRVTTSRPPKRPARRGTNGAIATRPAVAGRVARPACRGLKPSVLGSWK